MVNPDTVFWLERQLEMQVKKTEQLRKKYSAHLQVRRLKREINKLEVENKEMDALMWNENCLNFLIGKKIVKLLFNQEKDAFSFELEDGKLERFICEGECCSNSWIEHISGIQSLLGHTINDIIFLDIPPEKEYGEERTLIYRWDIYTKEGICTMEMRNHSNGYYCGELTHIEFEDGEPNFPEILDFQNPTIECTEDF